MKSFRTNLLVGSIVLLPVAVTIILANFLFQLILNFNFVRVMAEYLRLLLPPAWKNSGYEIIILKIIVVLVLMLLLAMLGYIVRSIMGRRLYGLFDKVLARIPVVNKIYVFVRQISESMLMQQKTLFKEVVLVEYPRRGLYSLAFVTAHMPKSFQSTVPIDQDVNFLSLFVPTTPNPTSGFFIMVPRDQCIDVKMELSDAMKLIFSGGVLFPGSQLAGQQPSLLDHLEALFEKKVTVLDKHDLENERRTEK